MLNNVTRDLQRNWVTHEKSKTMAVWCGGSDGFVCLWLSKSAHKHWHRDLPWTLPHKYRLAHAGLTSSLCFILPPLPLSVSLHTNVQSNVYFSTQWGEEEKTFHVEFIKQFECNYVNELCWIHAIMWTSGVHTVITSLIHSRSCLQWMFMTAEPFDNVEVPAFKFFTHAHSSSVFKTDGNGRENVLFLPSSPTRKLLLKTRHGNEHIVTGSHCPITMCSRKR